MPPLLGGRSRARRITCACSSQRSLLHLGEGGRSPNMSNKFTFQLRRGRWRQSAFRARLRSLQTPFAPHHVLLRGRFCNCLFCIQPETLMRFGHRARGSRHSTQSTSSARGDELWLFVGVAGRDFVFTENGEERRTMFWVVRILRTENKASDDCLRLF